MLRKFLTDLYLRATVSRALAESRRAQQSLNICAEHRGTYQTCGCVICGLIKQAGEIERLKAELARANNPTTGEPNDGG